VGQFTGLKDKDGKNIYEGDLVAVPSEKEPALKVRWSARSHAWAAGIYLLEYFTGRHAHVEVMGNAYENPELLTSAADGARS
jgi:hypothetical protein